MQYDIIIIGGGPAGTAAAVYAARKKLKTLLIAEEFGGQSINSADIQNWIGELHISGGDLAKKFENHIRAYPDAVEIKLSEKVAEVSAVSCTEPNRVCDFNVKTEKGDSYSGKAIILASGAHRRRMNVPGEDKFEGKGVAYCGTCDAPIFAGKKVAVVGGGNAGFETVQDLIPYAGEIYLLERSEMLKADPVTREEVEKNPKLKQTILNAEILEVVGDQFVTGIKYKDLKTGAEKDMAVGGVFVAIGSIPNSEIAKGLVDIDKRGQVIVDSKYSSTSHPGIFAAGDVTDDPFKQNNISAGDAVKATLSAYAYLLNRGK